MTDQMTRGLGVAVVNLAAWVAVTTACGSGGDDTGDGDTTPPRDDGGTVDDGGTDADADESGADADTDTGPDADADADSGTDGGTVSCDELRSLVEAYKIAHPGRGGKDWDINALTPAQVAADPAAQELLSVCGDDQRPVIPLLAWEYGGADHPWINPEASALVYCVYIPVSPSSSNWQYDAVSDHVTADVHVLCPEQNPCNDRTGANQVSDCIGDASNFEILVDIASLHDGADAGLSLAESSTELRLILTDGTKVHLHAAL